MAYLGEVDYRKSFETQQKRLVDKYGITATHAGCYIVNFCDEYICRAFNGGCPQLGVCARLKKVRELTMKLWIDDIRPAPHGAGRIMSRAKAKELISLEEFQDSMKDVYSSTVCKATIDEAPFAYKDMEEIMNAIEPTVEIIERIIPVYNYKATS